MSQISNKFVTLTMMIFSLLFVISVGLNIYMGCHRGKIEVVEKTVTRIIKDTIHDSIPQIKKETVVKYIIDTLTVVDTIPGDTVSVIVEVPISQKEYSDDSTYTAWVSGYKQNLDSINIYRKTIYIDNTITKIKKQNFVIGPQIGFGMTTSERKLLPMIGIGVTYNMFGF